MATFNQEGQKVGVQVNLGGAVKAVNKGKPATTSACAHLWQERVGDTKHCMHCGRISRV